MFCGGDGHEINAVRTTDQSGGVVRARETERDLIRKV